MLTNGATKSKQKTASSKAGLTFPVGRIARHLRCSQKKRVGAGAPVFLAAVLEYVCAEILLGACKATQRRQRKRIVPRDINACINRDAELHNLIMVKGAVIPFSGTANPMPLPAGRLSWKGLTWKKNGGYILKVK